MKLTVKAEKRLVIGKKDILAMLSEMGKYNPDNHEEIVIKFTDIPEKIEVQMETFSY